MGEFVDRLAELVLDQHLDHDPTQCRDCAVHLVRCLLTAARSPTKAMVQTGDNHTNCGGSCRNRSGWHAWASMIDESLREG